MTHEQTKRENTRNAAPAMIRLLRHFLRVHGYRMEDAEYRAAKTVIDAATLENDPNGVLLSEEYFNHIIHNVIYHK